MSFSSSRIQQRKAHKPQARNYINIISRTKRIRYALIPALRTQAATHLHLAPMQSLVGAGAVTTGHLSAQTSLTKNRLYSRCRHVWHVRCRQEDLSKTFHQYHSRNWSPRRMMTMRKMSSKKKLSRAHHRHLPLLQQVN